MASKDDKNLKPEPYDNQGWGDSITVSRKARKELKELAGNKEQVKNEVAPIIHGKKAEIRARNQAPINKVQQNRPVVDKTSSLARAIDSSINAPENTPVAKVNQELRNDVNEQVEKLNEEFDRAVSQIENIFDRFFNTLGVALNHLLLALYNLFLKILLIIFIEPIKYAGEFSNILITSMNKGLSDFTNWLSSDTKPVQTKRKTFDNYPIENTNNSRVISKVKTQAPIQVQKPQEKFADVPKLPRRVEIKTVQERYPHVFYGVIFGHLSKRGIIFLDIKNRPIYEEGGDFSVEDEQELLETAVKEIASCSKLAKNLPSPTKGKFANKDMSSVLENVSIADLKEFLMYVDNHPKPFLERKLRLSEAFATWAHKGAPL